MWKIWGREKKSVVYTSFNWTDIICQLRNLQRAASGTWTGFPSIPRWLFCQLGSSASTEVFFTCNFLQNTYWLFLSVRGKAFQTSAHSPVRYWPDILHDGNGLWAIMELLLKILAKLFTNSFCVFSCKIVLLLFWRRCKNVKRTLSVFVLLIFYSSSKNCAVLYHGNLSFQINKFRVEYNACCPESSCQNTLNIICQKDFNVWFFRKHPSSLSDTCLAGQ